MTLESLGITSFFEEEHAQKPLFFVFFQNVMLKLVRKF